MLFSIISGISFKSSLLPIGIYTTLIFLLYAAISFSFNPPIFKTFPFKVSSPVKAILAGILFDSSRLHKDTAIARPADGPSF